MAIRPRFQPESKLFPGKPGSCKTPGGFSAIFGGFQRFKKPRKAAVFFESGGIFGGKGRNPSNFIDSRIGRNTRLTPITPKKSFADWTMFLRFSLISRTRKTAQKSTCTGMVFFNVALYVLDGDNIPHVTKPLKKMRRFEIERI